VVTVSKETPNLLISSIKDSLVAAENSLREEDYRMALWFLVEVRGVASYAEDTLRTIISKESNIDMVHKPTLDRLAEWIEKYKESRNKDLIVNGIMDVVLEQMELMKDATV